MTEVYVHGVVAAGERPPEGVRSVVHGELAALVSDGGGDGERAAALVRRHWDVLERAGAQMTVLPVRFGTAMADDVAVAGEFLAPDHDRLAARLAALAGKVQLTVKGVYDEQALLRGVLARSPDVARLRGAVQGLPADAAYYKRIELGQLVSAEVERVREHDAELVVDRLARLALASRREAPSTLDGAVNAAFLVKADAVEAFTRAVGELADELSDRMRLRSIGPLAPYSFTDEEALAEAGAWA